MTKFPYVTLRNINDAAREVGCLNTMDTEREQALADELVRGLTRFSRI